MTLGFAALPASDAAANGYGGVALLTIFILSCFVGYEVISKVSAVLHTPLMSGANAIHGIILVGAIIVAGEAEGALELILAGIAIVLPRTTSANSLVAAVERPVKVMSSSLRTYEA